MDWKSEFSVGIPEIDEQHKQLFACIDRLEAAGDEQQRELAVYFVMDELKDYVRVHFAVEEIVMRLFDYPELEAHIAEHRAFAARLVAFGKMELVRDVHGEAGQFLRNWLLHHIMGSDKRYAGHLLRNGAPVRK